MLLEVERLMCGGMFRAAIALQQLGCIALPDAPFNTGVGRCCVGGGMAQAGSEQNR